MDIVRRDSEVIPNQIDVQYSPVNIGNDLNGKPQSLIVDLAIKVDKLVVIAGWCTNALIDVGLNTDKGELTCRKIRINRDDVAQHFGLASGEKLGYVLIGEYRTDEAIFLKCALNKMDCFLSGQLDIDTSENFVNSDLSALGPAIGIMALSLPFDSTEWRDIIARTPQAKSQNSAVQGNLDSFAVCARTKMAVVVGWVFESANNILWLEDGEGNMHSLEKAHRIFRQDVHEAMGDIITQSVQEAGFVITLDGVKEGTSIALKAVSEDGVQVLSEINSISLSPNPVSAARWLFNIPTPISSFHKRVLLVDEPVLTPLLTHRQSNWSDLPVQVHKVGKAIETPLISVIVPLYGRTDFVEHQMIEFYSDAWFKDHAQLIYVLDDPRLVDSFKADAHALYRLYGVPFTWVWECANRGFSGANNLGVQVAKGNKLLFLNSDVFPNTMDWLRQLCHTLDENRDFGVIGPQLLFADGSIQHAGMEFTRHEELGIWVNHHPNKGLDPILDGRSGLIEVPAVTGACLAIRRKDFDRVGGWDTGYLIGDFEDSDLCLKIRKEGMKVGYLPDIQLTHLERQSFTAARKR